MLKHFLLILACAGLFACGTVNAEIDKAQVTNNGKETTVKKTKPKKDDSVVKTNSESHNYDDQSFY